MSNTNSQKQALTNICSDNFLHCPNCNRFYDIKILGLRSHTNSHPRLTNEDQKFDYSLWFYCQFCSCEFGTTFTQYFASDTYWVLAESQIQIVNYQSTKPPQNPRKAIPSRTRYQVLRECNHTCQSCGATVEDGAKLEIDHIKPVSKGGTNDPDNLQVLCKDCNLGKSDIY
jgi:hypothetical protein